MAPVLSVGRALFRVRSWTPVPLALWVAVNARPRRRWLLPSITLVLAGIVMRLWAVAHIGPESRTRATFSPERRVRSGPYAVIEHPLYIANALLSGGLVLLSGAGWPWLQAAFPALWLMQYGPIMLWEDSTMKPRGLRRKGAPRKVGRGVARARWRLAWASERRTRQSVFLFVALIAVRAALGCPSAVARERATGAAA